MSTLWIILICLLAALLAAVIIASEMMCRGLAYPWFKPYEETIRRAKEDEDSYGNFDNYEKEPFDLVLRDGYEIHGDILPLDPTKVVIFSHGHGDNKYTMIRFVQVFRDLGYSAVIYDLRGHGHNERKPVKMGSDASKDLIEIIEMVRDRFPNAQLGIFGLSMGAATTAMTLGYHPNVDFAVLDCGYSSLTTLSSEIIAAKHFPAFMIYPLTLWNNLRFGYYLSEVEPQQSLEENEIPVCIIHGEADDYVGCSHSKHLFEHNKGEIKELHLIPEAAHAQAWLHDPVEYENIIRDFLAKI